MGKTVDEIVICLHVSKEYSDAPLKIYIDICLNKPQPNLLSETTASLEKSEERSAQKNDNFLPKAVVSFGGDYGTRTCDLMRVKHAL